jgi:hypothetical protein
MLDITRRKGNIFGVTAIQVETQNPLRFALVIVAAMARTALAAGYSRPNLDPIAKGQILHVGPQFDDTANDLVTKDPRIFQVLMTMFEHLHIGAAN